MGFVDYCWQEVMEGQEDGLELQRSAWMSVLCLSVKGLWRLASMKTHVISGSWMREPILI